MRVCLEPSEVDLGCLSSNTVREYICVVLSHPGCLHQPEETKTSYMTSRKIERDQGAHLSHPRTPDLAFCGVASSWSPNPGQVPKRESALGLSRALGKAVVLHQLQEGCSPTLSLQHTGHYCSVSTDAPARAPNGNGLKALGADLGVSTVSMSLNCHIHRMNKCILETSRSD